MGERCGAGDDKGVKGWRWWMRGADLERSGMRGGGERARRQRQQPNGALTHRRVQQQLRSRRGAGDREWTAVSVEARQGECREMALGGACVCDVDAPHGVVDVGWAVEVDGEEERGIEWAQVRLSG